MTRRVKVRALRAAFPECAILRGWHLDGPGPARFGWAAVAPTGRAWYLGRTLDSALAHERAVRALMLDAR